MMEFTFWPELSFKKGTCSAYCMSQRSNSCLPQRVGGVWMNIRYQITQHQALDH